MRIFYFLLNIFNINSAMIIIAVAHSDSLTINNYV
jgi:hypothetical protein